jgi:hypothetical protein
MQIKIKVSGVAIVKPISLITVFPMGSDDGIA